MRTEQVDVLVIGFGAAGASAALAAREQGARVAVVEKCSAPGGNCRHSGGFLFDVDGPTAVDHLDALCFGKTDRAVLEAYAAGLHEVPGWIAALGGQTLPVDPADFGGMLPSWPHLPGSGHVSYRQYDGGAERPGIALWRLLEGAVRAHDIDIACDSAATELIVRDGAVRGAVVGDRRIESRGGVVLASGGIEYDAELRDAYLPLPLVPVGHPGNTGDTLRLAQQAGASVWHMSAFFGWLAFRHPDFPAAFTLDVHAPSFIYVDADGRRFADETGWEVHDKVRCWTAFLPRNGNYPQLPGYIIFDEAARLAGPLHGIVGTPNDHVWSADNSVELERGWIKRADPPPSWPQRSASTAMCSRRPCATTRLRSRRVVTSSSAAPLRRWWTCARRCTRSRCGPAWRPPRAVRAGTRGPASSPRAASRFRACTRRARPDRSGAISPSTAAGSPMRSCSGGSRGRRRPPERRWPTGCPPEGVARQAPVVGFGAMAVASPGSLLVLQHIACEPPAAYEDELRAWGVELHRVEVDAGEPLPDWREFAGIVAMGGPMGAYEDERLPWLADEKRLIADAVRAGTPYWGVCLGAQLLAASLDAHVFSGPRAEVGVLPVIATEAAAADPVFSVARRRSSTPCSGTATPGSCRPAPSDSRARTPTSSRRSASSAPTRCSSTSRSTQRWPPSGARSPPTRQACGRCSATTA